MQRRISPLTGLLDAIISLPDIGDQPIAARNPAGGDPVQRFRQRRIALRPALGDDVPDLGGEPLPP
ncbi:MAG: hypothetical protein Q8K85_23070 [Hyphomicrobium sp.]|nr:hypothetical protein [Hyphomicrobium sp.]